MNQAKDFLNHLFTGLGGYLEITMFAPKGYDLPVKNNSYKIGVDRIDFEDVAAENARGYGVYYSLTTKRTPTQTRASERDTLAVPCLWADVDLKDGAYPDLDAIYHALLTTQITPTTIIFSGGGYHALWKIAPVEATADTTPAIKETLRGLAIALKGDTSVAETARVFRLPGTINTKPERDNALCEIDFRMWGHDYNLADFARYRKLAKPIKRAIQRDLPRHKPDDLPSTVQNYLNTFIAPGGRNAALNTAAWTLHCDGYSHADIESLLTTKALRTDGLPDSEVRAVIRSVCNAAPGDPSYLSKRTKLRIRAGEAGNRGV